MPRTPRGVHAETVKDRRQHIAGRVLHALLLVLVRRVWVGEEMDRIRLRASQHHLAGVHLQRVRGLPEGRHLTHAPGREEHVEGHRLGQETGDEDGIDASGNQDAQVAHMVLRGGRQRGAHD
jgi:hypothetical protein